jgi:S-formylglutathione hydrolase
LVYIDAAGRDVLNAHDGAESLHRELWTEDIPHEYHLRKNADHVGADEGPRLLRALQWVSDEPQPLAASILTAIEPQRKEAAKLDPTMHRHYGVIRG